VPSPLGHALGALAAGWTVSRPASTPRGLAIQASLFVLLGTAPDLDLLIGRHSRETHSVGAAVIAASVAALGRWPLASGPARIWFAACAAWLTHPLLDALSFDLGPPIGVMAFWPVSTEHWHTGFAPFDAIERHWDRPGFLRQNIVAVLREILTLVPVLGVVWFARRRSERRRAGP
jgi:membrane-bound metal-dependent hydrolase YbcI (DUF457 family)